MEPESVERKLTAILSADVKGYSRLMGDDEEATLRTLTAYREVFSSHIQQHRGRVVNTPGDAILSEFASVVDALRCAVEIQRELAERNAELPENRRMLFRMGINLGDVLVKDGDIFGDGVNIAARLEGLADPGGISISGSAHEQVKGKLDLEYDYQGKRSVKNIMETVPVYRVLSYPGAAAHRVVAIKRRFARSWRIAALAAGLAVLLGGGAVAAWYLLTQPTSFFAETKTREPPPLPDKPSLAVLPFVNTGGDPAQAYFSDGMAEEITTTLSRLSNLFVIAADSAFTYKGRDVDLDDVGEELGVRHVLEGSARNADGRIRIDVRLVEAATGNEVWSQEYDRDLPELFAVQHEITRRIVTELNIELAEDEEIRVWRRPTDNLEAYDAYLRGLELSHRLPQTANAQAIRMLDKAIELDPEFAAAYALLARVHMIDFWYQWSPSRLKSRVRAVELASKAIALDDSEPMSYAVLGLVHLFRRQPERAITELERAAALSPNDSVAGALMANALMHLGRLDEALVQIKKAMRVAPEFPAWYWTVLGDVHRRMGGYDEAIAAFKENVGRNPENFTGHILLIATYGALGEQAEAGAQAAELLRLHPKFHVDGYISGYGPRALIYHHSGEKLLIAQSLREAGLK